MIEGGEAAGTAREVLCRLLAVCYYEPGPEFAEEGVFASMRAAARELSPELDRLAARLGEDFAAESGKDLLVDYTRLFLGPVDTRARPYGSVWLEREGTLLQDSTLAVLDLYAEGGFDIDPAFRDLPDHVAAELEFLYLLIFRENEARRAGDAASLATWTSLRRRFLDGHLGRWVGPFTGAVRAGAQSRFYRDLGELTEKFVGAEGRTG
jgi:TorA maturation chaperone TorD